MPRLVKNVYEIIYTKQAKDSGLTCDGFINPAKCLVYFNNFVLVINASSGFFVYCFVGSFGQKFMEELTNICPRKQRTTENGKEFIELQNNPKKPGKLIFFLYIKGFCYPNSYCFIM